MVRGGADTYRRWFEYERDSHAKVLQSLANVPEAQRSSEAFEKATSLLGHVVAAREMWLYRFGVAKQRPQDFFPRNLTVDDITARVGAMEAAWLPYLERLDDAELGRIFEYQSIDGRRFRNSVEDILTQLFGHSWYHRGQIAQLVRSTGAEPAVTDFVFWTRELIE